MASKFIFMRVVFDSIQTDNLDEISLKINDSIIGIKFDEISSSIAIHTIKDSESKIFGFYNNKFYSYYHDVIANIDIKNMNPIKTYDDMELSLLLGKNFTDEKLLKIK